MQFGALELEEEDEIVPIIKNVPKRLCVKDSLPSGSSSRFSRSSSPPDVDVRMIDFAHTSFLRKTDTVAKSVHEGPDGGFLTGLDSLKRLLLQIISSED